MAAGENQKLKYLYLLKIFMENTDELHGITLPEIIDKLEKYGVTAARKALYEDIEMLRKFGIDIISEKQHKKYVYYIGKRELQLPELKLLVDSVQSAKFITEKKSQNLIKKLEKMCSKYEARELHRQVIITGKVKTDNESVFYNVDTINSAINNNKEIRFKYFQWNVKKEMELRHEGEWYYASPWNLIWDNENYYLIAFDEKSDNIRHYRVDKMLRIEMTESSRVGKEKFESIDISNYEKQVFGMFVGRKETVTLECINSYAGIMIDRFGKNIILTRKDVSHFTIRIEVAVSRQFLSWIISLGEGVRIIAPDNVIALMQDEIVRLQKIYI